MEKLTVSWDDLQIVLTHFTLGVRGFSLALVHVRYGHRKILCNKNHNVSKCSPSNSNCTMYRVCTIFQKQISRTFPGLRLIFQGL